MKMHDQLCGVNLGGWLVVEKWLIESLFEGTDAWDEYALMRTEGAREKIKRHRQTYITEDDFAWLAQHGVNAVRIPVGYWLFEAQDGYTPTVAYLDAAMSWAEKYGIKVLIDLHGVRGSQNGGDHSGRKGRAEWFEQKQSQEQAIELLVAIAERYGDSRALWGIELLNEPAAKGRYWMLLRFYRRAYHQLRQVLRPGVHIVFHDGFHPLLFAGALRSRKSHPVVMDVHWYAFSLGRQRQFADYARYTRRSKKWLLRWVQLWQPVIVGEWSTVLPQSVFDATPQTEHTALLGRNAAYQQMLYGRALGNFYWNYKAEGCGMWHFRSLVEDGVLSMDVTEEGRKS